jgi:hypothetical protein
LHPRNHPGDVLALLNSFTLVQHLLQISVFVKEVSVLLLQDFSILQAQISLPVLHDAPKRKHHLLQCIGDLEAKRAVIVVTVVQLIKRGGQEVLGDERSKQAVLLYILVELPRAHTFDSGE